MEQDILLACGKAGSEIRKRKIRKKDKVDFMVKNLISILPEIGAIVLMHFGIKGSLKKVKRFF
jgi:hypothetical protein